MFKSDQEKTQYIQILDKWIFKNSQSDAIRLRSMKTKIPQMFKQYDQELYRGMRVDSTFLDKLNKSGVKFDKITSWSKSKESAKRFTNDKKYIVASSNRADLINILVKKKIDNSRIICDIYNMSLFLGEDEMINHGLDELSYDSIMNEQEVLVDSNVIIKMSDIEFI